MASSWLVVLWTATCLSLASPNSLPVFIKDMNNLPLSESTPVGTKVYTLEGQDPDGYPIKYGLQYTDKFTVDPVTGDVTLAKPLDREVEDTVKFEVSIEKQNPDSDQNLTQTQPVTVIVLDENDNEPVFKNAPYEVDVPENEVVGTIILNNIIVEDRDSIGDNLEVECLANDQWPDACNIFEVITVEATANQYTGALILKQPLDYNQKQFYQFQLIANDGLLKSTAHVEVKVIDIQNSPPVFGGSLSAALSEDAPVGTLALTVKARDADRAQPRDVIVELVTNPLDFFVLDPYTGELKTAKPLDREALPDPSSPLNLTVRASEIVNGVPVYSNLTSTKATVTVNIKDVNDEPPRFNKREYSVEIPENLPLGTPLPNLDMVVTDTDMGLNSVFTLRLSDEFGAFIVEPDVATGSASVTLRLNATLDYEDPNQRKFIIEVIAEELHTSPRLSSKASVTITLTDVNDNAPVFEEDPVTASVVENAPGGTWVTDVKATDRDIGRFGTDGIVYQLSGNGAELFNIDSKTGVITVANCPTPGLSPCLDYETRKDYFLQLKATDEYGAGQSSVISLQISLLDSNDNPPVFVTPVYKASIDEDAVKFEPELQVAARDADASSELFYSIISPKNHPFWVDPVTGKIGVLPDSAGFNATENDKIFLTVQATDGLHNATAIVEISIRDVNNHAPVFDAEKYDADISEDAPSGTQVAAVSATDMDSGINSEIKYSIQKGAYDSFEIDNVTGIVTVSSQLDYDKKNTYRIQIIATDLGMPSLTGTTELTVHVINVNDKRPYFTPPIQRAEVSADADLGALVHTLIAEDPDITDPTQLLFDLSGGKLIRAVDKNGIEVSDEGIFGSWFTVLRNGSVVVSQRLDRSRAAVVTLPVSVIDASAPTLQQADGELIITIVDVNRHAPVFSQPSYYEKFVEEQPVGTILNTYTATDKETPISAMVIDPPNQYFAIDNVTGVVKSIRRIDYESVHFTNFTLVAYDSGVPQLSTTASVVVEIVNDNDEEPKFLSTTYEGKVAEHSPAGTEVLKLKAKDMDEGDYGEVTYSLSGELSFLFSVNPRTGVVTVAEGANIDREKTPDIWLRAIATDNGTPHTRKSTTVPVNIKVLDINDNAPVFTQSVYKSTIAENLQLNPPATILQVLAEDKDEGVNGVVEYKITEQSEPGIFTIDSNTGIIYPARNVTGDTTYHLTVTATDGAGFGTHTASAKVDITVLSVNRHSPVFVQPPPEIRQVEIVENAAQADYLVTVIKATDEDSGENGRVSYYFKVDNQNVGETPEFSINKDTGELRTKTFLDRELKADYQLVIVAADNGNLPHETLLVLSVVLADEDDNAPQFHQTTHFFNVRENLPPGVIVGSVKAIDKDSGDNGLVFYHVLEGNQDEAFSLNKKSGVIKTNISFDRETQSEYTFSVYASNSPILSNAAGILNSIDNRIESNNDITIVTVRILDENDNQPVFKQNIYYAGIKYTTHVNQPVITVVAEDPDLEENGTLVYLVAASNLYKFGASKSSGSVLPSPFNISEDGVITTAQYMSEYNQDRFVLDIIAQEIAAPHRQAKAQVYVWVIDRTELIRMVLSRSCLAKVPLSRLASAANVMLIPGRRVPYSQADTRYDHWCELHLHAVDPVTYQVLPVEKVLETIDSKYDDLKGFYEEYGVETLIAASATSKAPDSFDPALAALIAILIVLFTGIVTFIVVCACLKHWVIPPPSMQSSKGDSLSRRRILEELSTTENPLWLETKLRPYEEQELTMNVFGDQLETGGEPPQTDNTYATIQGSRTTERFGDYATLGGDSPTPLEAALGFQGSTFKPPSPDTPEPPPRPSAGLGQL